MYRASVLFVTCTVAISTAAACSAGPTTQPEPPPSAAPTAATTPSATASAGSAAEAQPATTASTAPTMAAAPPAVANNPTMAMAPPGGAAPAGTAATPPAATMPVDPALLDHTQDIRGHCGLNTGFADDSACLIPPRPNEGFQLHVGPKDYNDPAEVAKFVMKPGEESSECFTFRTTNPEKITYQTYIMSGRAGTHHIITRTYSGNLPEDTWGNCGGVEAVDFTDLNNIPMQNGYLPTATKAYMPRGKVAPEYAHVGRVIEAKTLVQSDMHYYNFTDKDILREYWMNVYYPTPEQKITDYADVLVGFGGTGWSAMPIEPGTDMVYKYECPFTGTGNLLNLYGHYHAHGKRFTSTIKRASGQIEKIFEMYDFRDPAVYDYNSVTQNPMFSASAAGATSGPITVSQGDILQWECHIINDGSVPLGFTNEVNTGEMCNIWGFTIGVEPFQCFLQ